MNPNWKKHATVAAAALASLLSSADARAQQIKGRVMVLVDTSGSMLLHFNEDVSAGGDGDANSLYSDVKQVNRNFYPGNYVNGLPDGPNSRLYAAKLALMAAINATGDIDFGLMRYAPAPLCTTGCTWPQNGDYCQNGINCCDFTSPGCTKFNGGYVQNNAQINWAGGCGVMTTDASGNNVSTDGGQILVKPSALDAAKDALRWVDNVEDFRSASGSIWPQNPELRGAGPTPLSGSVLTALNQWYKPIFDYTRANPNCKAYDPKDPSTNPLCDPQIDCRPYSLVVMTDGVEECDKDSGGAFLYNNPISAVSQLYAANNPKNPVLTYVVGLAISKPEAISVLDNMAAAGHTQNARFANDKVSIQSAFGDIIASSVKVESCNGLDDNCNTRIDEGLGVYQECTAGTQCTSGTCNGGRCTCENDTQCESGYLCSAGLCVPGCATGIGACLRTGVKKCGASSGATCCENDNQAACTPLQPGDPGPLICQPGMDNNCNGILDVNEPGCQGQTCTPVPETCNGKDDDCDGTVDNNLVDVGRDCGLNVGECKPGKTVCENSKLVCVGGTDPKDEVCNGLDDDCDGVIDGMTQACYDGPSGTAGVGVCIAGSQRCNAVVGSGMASWTACIGQIMPGTEVCNGIDDNCNGTIDDVPGAGEACCPPGREGLCGKGICTTGTMQCSGGALVCTGGQGPQAEVCNGFDDDCNDKVDDLAAIGKACLAQNGCQGTLACDTQQMTLVCVASQMSCVPLECDGDPRIGQPCGPVGLPMPCMAGEYQCKNNSVTCVGAVQPRTEACNCSDDDCNGAVDDNAYCPPGYDCLSGSDCGCFKKCQQLGEFGYICDGGYYCDPNDYYCKPDKPCTPPCPTGQLCDKKKGECYDPCAGVSCPASYVCENGRCVGNTCVEGKVKCDTCQRCDTVQRTCVPDLCCNKNCEAGTFCDPVDGTCKRSCLDVQCPSDQFCIDGACRPNPCVANNVLCKQGELCVPETGMCAPDACRTKVCIAPLICVAGECVQDLCSLVTCPAGSRCETSSFTGSHSCVTAVPIDQQDRVVGAGSGGFAFGCNTGAGRNPASGGALAMVALALLGLVARRRPRGRFFGGW